MSTMNSGVRKSIITLIAVAVVALAIVIVGPVLYRVFTHEGVRTGDFEATELPAATTDTNGTWKIIGGDNSQNTSVGFTFNEVLPGSRRTTSGSTHEVTGELKVANNNLEDASVVVDMATLTSDIERRDINVRNNIFSVEQYPEAKFELAEPLDISSIPDNGQWANIEIPGRLTIRGVTNDVTVPMKVARTENLVLLSGTLPINRLDYNVRLPQFVAASIEENGELNLRIVAEKQDT
ncbi:YceI family protein [Corynebacterium amycolatum]|uniref:YceI family protein n=1 Tax=Corynebacterium amycolatum TaxID=43765 RepID=UPI000E1FC30B|nr:YceI family protein [Corynebacterium amycolatum]